MKLLRGLYGGLGPGVQTFFCLLPVFILAGLAASVLVAAYVDSPFVESIAIPVVLLVALTLFGVNHLLASAVADAREGDRERLD